CQARRLLRATLFGATIAPPRRVARWPRRSRTTPASVAPNLACSPVPAANCGAVPPAGLPSRAGGGTAGDGLPVGRAIDRPNGSHHAPAEPPAAKRAHFIAHTGALRYTLCLPAVVRRQACTRAQERISSR